MENKTTTTNTLKENLITQFELYKTMTEIFFDFIPDHLKITALATVVDRINSDLEE